MIVNLHYQRLFVYAKYWTISFEVLLTKSSAKFIQICHFQLPNIVTFKTMLQNKHVWTREWMLSIFCLIYNGVAELDLWLMILKFKIHFNNFHCRRILKFEFYLIRVKILTSEAIVDLRDKIDPELYLINQCRNVWLIIYLQH